MNLRWISVALCSTLVGCNLYTPLPSQSVQVQLNGSQPQRFFQALEGEWQVQTPLPEWLDVSQESGNGDIDFQLQATAECSAQSGEVRVRWNKALVGVGSTVLKVQYTPANGVAPSSRNQVSDSPQDRDLGVIVRYRTAAATRKALARSSAVGGSETSGRVLVRGVPLETLRADPEVLSATPNVPLYPIYGLPGTAVQGGAVPQPAAQARSSALSAFNPPDQYYPLQWAFRALGYPQVWADLKTRSDLKPTVVAVLDGGIRYDHPDLEGRLVQPGEGALDLVGLSSGYGDGFGPDTDPTDPSAPVSNNSACTTSRLMNSSHGTHVSGIIVAGTGEFAKPCPACSSSGVVGAALFAPVKVLPLRVISMRDQADSFGVASAIRYVAGESLSFGGQIYTNPLTAQTRVINLSLGGYLSPNSDSAKELCSAVSFARSRGILTVAASGNGGREELMFPAACADAVSVGSVGNIDSDGRFTRASYSNYGAGLTLTAPGGEENKSTNGGTLNGQPYPDQIFSTDWDYLKNQPKYESKVGTSQASPQVAALAALIFARGLESTPQGVLERLKRSALDAGVAGPDNQYGAGVIQPLEALDLNP